MRLTRAIGVIGVTCVLGFGCAATGNYGTETYVVRPQDTLYSIAWRHDLDYRDLARWNNLGADYRIVVGQVLVLAPGAAPGAAAPGAAATPGIASSAAPSAQPHAHEVPHVGQPRPLASPPGGTPGGTPAAHSSGGGAAGQWMWPTEHASAPRPVPGGGILLLGQLGQPVLAASGGRVVYVGNGLRGYGNLIIIKHGDTLLSAYAHNRDLLVREGQDVARGQTIARMGTGPHQIAALYFEIRLNGKPVDPLPYLPGAK